eukprot:jgi/Mesvir1/6725/Mv12096-RA.1
MAQTLAVGIDIGADVTVAAVGGVAANFGASTLVPNEMSNLATPTLCSFHGVDRSIGEPAVGQRGVNPRNTVTGLVKLLGTSHSEWSAAADPHNRYETQEGIGGRVACAVEYGGQPKALLPEQLLAMLLLKLLAQAKRQATTDAGAEGGRDGSQGGQGPCRWKAVLAVPTAYGPAQKAAVMDAARIAGLFDNGNTCQVVSSEAAVASCYSLKHPLPETDAAPRNVVFVDVGDEYVSVAAYRINPGYGAPTRLAARGEAGLGVSAVDKALFDHWAQVSARTKGVTITPGSKSGFRLREAVARARRALSTGTEARADLDGVGEHDAHITLHVTRDELVGLCAGLRASLQNLISSVIAEAGLPAGTSEAPLVVELVGGGTRIPWIRDTIATAAAGGSDSPADLANVRLSNMLDGTSSVAQGASYMAEAGLVLEKHANFVAGGTGDGAAAIERLLLLARSVVPADSGSGAPMEVDSGAGARARLSEEDIQAAVALEAQMAEADRVAAARADARNSLESYVLELRSRATGGDKHSNLLDADKLLPILQEAEDWLYDEEGGGAAEVAPEKVSAKEASLKEQVKDLTAAYYAAVEADRVQMEAELVAAAAAAEASGEGKEDHDFRKLKKADRMRLAVKNKEEGNELFQGGVYGQAIERYSHALRHCTKFVDLSPDDEKEVAAMKVSLHLNMAMAFLKMASSPNDVDTYKKAAESCTQALELDPVNTKALFRRGKVGFRHP